MYAIECNRSATEPNDAEFLKYTTVFLRARRQPMPSEKGLKQAIAKVKAKPGVLENISNLVRQDSMVSLWKTLTLPAAGDPK